MSRSSEEQSRIGIQAAEQRAGADGYAARSALIVLQRRLWASLEDYNEPYEG